MDKVNDQVPYSNATANIAVERIRRTTRGSPQEKPAYITTKRCIKSPSSKYIQENTWSYERVIRN